MQGYSTPGGEAVMDKAQVIRNPTRKAELRVVSVVWHQEIVLLLRWCTMSVQLCMLDCASLHI